MTAKNTDANNPDQPELESEAGQAAFTDNAEQTVNDNPQSGNAPAVISDEAQQIFLKQLSITGDVIAASELAGHDDAAFFMLRLSGVAFAAQWDAAMEFAYLRLESALVAYALRAATTQAANADLRIMAAQHRLALNLLAAHRTSKGQTKRGPYSAHANARGALLNKLELMRQRAEDRRTNMASNDG
jgi:hypothetical protein